MFNALAEGERGAGEGEREEEDMEASAAAAERGPNFGFVSNGTCTTSVVLLYYKC